MNIWQSYKQGGCLVHLCLANTLLNYEDLSLIACFPTLRSGGIRNKQLVYSKFTQESSSEKIV